MVAPSSESMVEPNTPAATPSGNIQNSQGADDSCVDSKLATKKLTPTNKPPAALAAVPSTLMPPTRVDDKGYGRASKSKSGTGNTVSSSSNIDQRATHR
jgi:hypothetical protein